MRWHVFAMLFAVASGTSIAAHSRAQANLSAVQLFALADKARAGDKPGDAETIYRALTHDPDIEIRSEARFRLGMMLADEKRYKDAALAFRALLDEKPKAARVRLELARVLALMGDDAGARRELRQAQAAGLPPEVAVAVNKFAGALHSVKDFGGSFEVTLAPDTNINRATRSSTLDTVFFPLTLDQDARAQSGVGLKIGGQAYGRAGIAPHLDLLVRASGQANLYVKHRFDDVAGSLVAGPEITLGHDRLRPAVGATLRWFGGDPYTRSATATVNWLHIAGKRTQIETDLTASRDRYPINALQDGATFAGSVAVEHAFTARTGGSLTLSANRQAAADPGYATASGGIGALAWRDTGRMTLYGTIGYNHLEADARLFLFPERRKDDNVRVTLGAVLRQFAFRQFAPLVRVSWERNASSVGLYDYRRASIEVGLSRAF